MCVSGTICRFTRNTGLQVGQQLVEQIVIGGNPVESSLNHLAVAVQRQPRGINTGLL